MVPNRAKQRIPKKKTYAHANQSDYDRVFKHLVPKIMNHDQEKQKWQ